MRIFSSSILSLAGSALAIALMIPQSRAQTRNETSTTTDRALSPRELREDLQLLRRAMTEANPSIYRYRSRAEIAAAFDAAERRILRPMDVTAFYRIVAPALAAIRDGHTQPLLPEATNLRFRATAPLLPFRFHIAQGRLFIARDLRPASGGEVLAGREVLGIDGRSAANVISRLSAVQSGDGTIPSSRIATLRSLRFNNLYGIFYGAFPAYRLRLRGSPRPLRVPGQPLDALQQRLDQRFPAEAERPPAELALLDGDRVAILTIRGFDGFADRAGRLPLEQFIDDAFNQMRTRRTRSLIIDVRGNGGGRDQLGRILLQHLLDRPFTYYRGLYLNGRNISFASHVDRWPGPVPDGIAAPDAQGRLRLLLHTNLGEHRPTANSFGGRVVALMDGGSFSTTAEFLSALHFHRRATFVGEESGGAYYGDTGGVVLILTLPNSGIRVRLPMVRYEMAVSGSVPADRGVPPDFTVEPSVGDLLGGRDRAMERALQVARTTPQRPDQSASGSGAQRECGQTTARRLRSWPSARSSTPKTE